MLSVRRGAKAVEFYKAAFGAVETFRIDSESGEVEHKNFSPESLGGGTVRMVMTVEAPTLSHPGAGRHVGKTLRHDFKGMVLSLLCTQL